MSGGNTKKSVVAHSHEEEKMNETSLKGSQGTATVNTVCEPNDMADDSCRVTILGLDDDLIKSQNHISSRKTDRFDMVTVPERHLSTVTAIHNVEGPMNTGDASSGTVAAMCERPGRQVVWGGATISATAEVTRAEPRAGAAAGLPGLPGPLPEGGLLQYPIN